MGADVVITRETLANNLKLTRKNRKIGEVEAARILNVSQEQFSEMEAGTRPFSSLDIYLLSYLLTFLEKDILKGPAHEHCRSVIKRGTGLATADLDFGKLRVLLADWAALAGKRPADFGSVSFETLREARDPKAAADEIVSRLSGQSSSQVDVREAAALLGVDMFVMSLPANLCGMLVSHPLIGKVAIARRQDIFSRQRFTFAHELGHAVFDAADRSMALVFRKPEIGLPPDEKASEERANAFAAYLLVPPDALRSALMTEVGSDSKGCADTLLGTDGVVRLAKTFGVGYTVMARRLEEDEFVTDDRLLNDRDTPKVEGSFADLELSGVLAKLADARLVERALTPARFDEMKVYRESCSFLKGARP